MQQKYKRMLAGMARKEKKISKRRLKRNWAVYVLRCGDGTLYTGVTNDLERRVKMHNQGAGARYTRDRGPVELLYHENRMTRSQALIRECIIKALPKTKKEDLVLGRKIDRKKRSLKGTGALIKNKNRKSQRGVGETFPHVFGVTAPADSF